jgi:hypothetical protein
MDVAAPMQALKDRQTFGGPMLSFSQEMARYITDSSAHSKAAFAEMRACRTPFDVIKVQQTWLLAQGKIHLESGMRIATAMSKGHVSASALFGVPQGAAWFGSLPQTGSGTAGGPQTGEGARSGKRIVK